MHRNRTQTGKMFARLLLAAVVLCSPGLCGLGVFAAASLSPSGKTALPVLATAHAAEPAPEFSGTRILLHLNAEPQLQQELWLFGETLLQEAGLDDPYKFLARVYPEKKILLRSPGRPYATLLFLLVLCNKDFLLVPEPGSKGIYSLACTEEYRQQRTILLLQDNIAAVRLRLEQARIEAAVTVDAQPGHMVITAPGLFEPDTALKALGNTAPLEFYLVRDDIMEGQQNLPPGLKLLPVKKDSSAEIPEDRHMAVESPAAMSGRHVSRATATRSSYDDNFLISLQFDGKGSDEFAALTAASVGRRLAITLDGTILSAPAIMESITGGEASISGNFTQEEAADLALVLQEGALPNPLDVVNVQVTGESGE